MAVTGRSSRAIDFDRRTACSAHLGPGTYETFGSNRNTSSRAPFSSTTERRTHAMPDINTPGPGSYGPATLSVEAGASPTKTSSNFASRTARMHSDVEIPRRAGVPGPGSYATKGPNWVKPTANVKGVAEREKAAPPHRSIHWVKVSTAPSIPAPSQSYGYEEGPKGELIQQQPPNVGFTGKVQQESAGPGYYNPKLDVTKPTVPKGANFSASRVQRDGVKLSKETLAAPGPGTYSADDRQKNTADEEPPKPTHTFVSATSRDHLTFGRTNDTPGPGAYVTVNRWKTVAEHQAAIPEHMQAFGSTSKKLFDQASTDQHPVPLRNPHVPGPGAYTAEAKNAAKSSGRHGAFASTSVRFQNQKTTPQQTPGPGYYAHAAENRSVSGQVQRKMIGRYGVFGTTAQRFPINKVEKSLGPGAYDPKDGSAPAEVRKKDTRSAVFSSTSQRGGQKETTAKLPLAPPVGSYDPSPSNWVKKTPSVAENFMPRAPRFSAKEAALAGGAPVGATGVHAGEPTPGPGHYDSTPSHGAVVTKGGGVGLSTFKGLDRTGFQKPYGSQTVRFPTNKETTERPGPGSYSVNTPLLKKTYNITIGDL